MRKYISIISFVITCFVLAFVCSCIKDDEVENSPTCVITSISVNDITSYLTTKASDGTDSMYTRTISGKNIKFNIDQVNGKIYSIDSLPSWTNLKRVVASFSYTGTLYARYSADSLYYPISNGTDSLDLSTPLDLLVVASDGASSKHYTAVIYRYTANADSMLWTAPVIIEGASITSTPKLIAANNQLYLFADIEGKPSVSYGFENNEVWFTYPELTTTANHLDCQSVQYFNGKFYALDIDGTIYASDDAITWNAASNLTVQKLLAADHFYLYAFDGKQIIATANLNTWTANGTRHLNMLPEQFITSVAYDTRTNSSLQVDVMAGVTNQHADYAVVWYKIAAKEQASNQQWDYITVTSENVYPLPALNNLTIFHYNDALYALGGDNKLFYKSEDNGITWKQVTENQFPPSTLIANKPVGIAVSGEHVIMIQANNAGRVTMWKGKINKLK